MAGHTFRGKRKLCYTEVTDFTDFQGVGQDPLYIRYDSVSSAMRMAVSADYQHFLSIPNYDSDEGVIYWFVDEWSGGAPSRLVDLTGDERAHYDKIKDETIDHWRKALGSLKGESLQVLSSAMKYVDDGCIYCLDDKVFLVAWGMKLDTNRHKTIGSSIHECDIEIQKYRVTFDVGRGGKLANRLDGSMSKPEGSAVLARDLPKVIELEGFSFKGWSPNPVGYVVNSDVVFTANYEEKPKEEPQDEPTKEPIKEPEKTPVQPTPEPREPELAYHDCVFEAGQYGSISSGSARTRRVDGYVLEDADIPTVEPQEGYRFTGWSPYPYGYVVDSDVVFSANYEKELEPVPEPLYHNCTFDVGQNGTITSGSAQLRRADGYVLGADDLPSVEPQKGYRFTGWSPNPVGSVVLCDRCFTAQYEEVTPWYRKLWDKIKALFLSGRGCLKWLLWLLFVLIILWLLSLFFRSCAGSSHDEVNGVVPIDTISSPDGGYHDDNGVERPVTGDDGKLPDGDFGVSPIRGDDGQLPPIVKKPGAPDIIGNRLILFLEDEDGDIDALARDFKKEYSDSRYAIIGFDRQVKSLVIRIPESEREEIKSTIKDKLPNYEFIVFDEQIYGQNDSPSQSPTGAPGWHIKAIHLKEAWAFTKGSPDVRVAIVDDGIQSSHPIFEGRIVDAYNVFTQDNRLSEGTGHGTHTAGLAAGSDMFLSKGASGVAPNCLIIPIQVFDNGQCPFSAWISGIMYAIHHGADVVNISIGPALSDLSGLSAEQQEKIARTQYKNEEVLWNRVCKLSAEKRCILVFAAGNDHILSIIPPENRNKSAITVAAVDSKLRATDFTNYGPGTDISAPGKDINSSVPTSTLMMQDGTSMAAPIVSGVVALMKSINKDITVEQVSNVLYNTGAKTSGNVPPMVLADKALKDTKDGVFDRRGGEAAPAPGSQEGIDRDAILRQIEEYKRRIADCEQKVEELEALLRSSSDK